MSRKFVFALALVALLAGASADAQDGEPEGWAYDLAGEMLSPFCPGVTLAECSSSQAKSLTMWMVVQEAAGRSRAEVEEELYARYGEQIRPTPRTDGFGLAAYVIPIGAFAAGGLLIAVFLRRQTREAAFEASEQDAASELDPELARIVDEDIAG